MSLNSALPPYPSKLVDYYTLSDSQFYERVGRAMNLTDIDEVKKRIHSLEEDSMSARNLFQQIEQEDADSRAPTPPPQLPPFPSESLDYMTLTDDQFYERACHSLYTNDVSYVHKFIGNKSQSDARLLFQSVERRHAKALNSPNLQRIGTKPAPGEEVIYAQLNDNITVRLWRGELERQHMFCLDFVYSDDISRHRRKPENIKLYSRGPFAGELFSIEQAGNAFARAVGRPLVSPYCSPEDVDKEWETVLVTEGTAIDISQGNYPRTTLQVPGPSGERLLVPTIGYA
ncbi:hypothetical protein BDQ17DRAFT_1330979 [Cyathus striatus]|nr:hypothetical protein BDQ17DRAFT_1330979 [Cyathus striatus]